MATAVKDLPTFDEVSYQESSLHRVQVECSQSGPIIFIFESFDLASPKPLNGFESPYILQITCVPNS